jgi:hypothetical protein
MSIVDAKHNEINTRTLQIAEPLGFYGDREA